GLCGTQWSSGFWSVKLNPLMRSYNIADITRNLEQKTAQRIRLRIFHNRRSAGYRGDQGVCIQFMEMGDGGLMGLLEP
ncbi:MAG: hypothetical protein WA869_13625, partial [Alloacidobacterium sp.]